MSLGFKCVRQRDSMQCGVACLAMVCRHYGARASLDLLDGLCAPTAEGVSLKGISDAAGECGFEATGVRISLDRLCEMQLPAILHWNQNHFTVLYRISGKGSSGRERFHIADPAKGKMALTREEFSRHWLSRSSGDAEGKGVALILQPGDGFSDFASKCAKDRISLGVLAGYLRRYRSHFIRIALCLAIVSGLQLVIPFLMQSIMDRGIKNSDIGFIWLVLLGELMIVAGVTAADFIRRWLSLRISMHVNIAMVSDFFVKLMTLPMSYFDTKLMGDLLQRMGDHSRVQSFITGQTLSLVFNTFSFLIFGAVLLVYDPLIFGVYLFASALYFGWTLLFLQKRRTLDYATFEQQAVNNNRTYQLITSMQEIKLQGCEKRRRQEWEEVQMELFGLQMKGLKLQQRQEAGSVFINEAKNILVTVLAATAVINGHLTLGGMLAIQYIIGQLNAPLGQLISFIYGIQDVKLSLERINEIRSRRDEDEGRILEYSAPESERDGITLTDVVFRYDRHDPRKAIDGVSLHIPAGKVTAIVGASGSGKTTLMKLMLGYYSPEYGVITVDGMSLAEMRLAGWRSHCGVVMQDGVVFSESIERNIATGDGDVDCERLRYAARTACIDSFIDSLPLGYATKIGQDGVGLSQGQKQRLLIARAVYRNADFLFLDEATNSLDALNERSIVENLREFYKGKTVVVVAHRLSTVCDADHIIVLERGKVVEQGNHVELTRRRGAYYNLVRNQLELGE